MCRGPVYLLVLLSLISAGLGVKLNTPRILLPFNFQNNPVSYVLEVTEAVSECFTWSSLQPDIVSVKAIDTTEHEGVPCSRSAIVTALSRQSSTHKVIVLAEDTAGDGAGAVLRCDVIVDRPTELSIATTTRELYVDEAAEEFELVAHDAAGNQFSSLDALAFRWHVSSGSGGGDNGRTADDVIRVQPFAASNYDSTPAVRRLESRGLHGDKVLLVGMTTGVARVTADVHHSGIKLSTEPVLIKCVANLLLLPADVYLLPGAVVNYTVAQMKHARLHYIDIGQSAYYLSVNDTSVAALAHATTETNSVRALTLGHTEVALRDANMAAVDSGDSDVIARLFVVRPARVAIATRPHADEWLTVIGRRVRLQCHLYDEVGNQIWPSDNAQFDIVVDSEYFSVDHRVLNGSYVEGVALKIGRISVKASLVSYRLADGSVRRLSSSESRQHQLSTSAVLTVVAPLSVWPPHLVLPCAGDAGLVAVTAPSLHPAVYSHQLNYTGGGGGGVVWNIDWQRCQLSASTAVDQHGVLTVPAAALTHDDEVGRCDSASFCRVTVSLQLNRRVSASVEVHVVPVLSVSWLAGGVREAELIEEDGVGGGASSRPLLLPLVVTGLMAHQQAEHTTVGVGSESTQHRLVNLTDCRSVALSVSTQSQHVSARLTDGAVHVAGACRHVAVTSTRPGHARVTVRLGHAPTVSATPAAHRSHAVNATTSDAAAAPPTDWASCVVGFYRRLRVQRRHLDGDEVETHAADGAVVGLLAPGCSWTVHVLGGPLAWPTDRQLHQITADSADRTRVSVSIVSAVYSGGGQSDGDALATVTVLCSSTLSPPGTAPANHAGGTVVTVRVGNLPRLRELPQPAVATAPLLVQCALPDRLELASAAAAATTDDNDDDVRQFDVRQDDAGRQCPVTVEAAGRPLTLHAAFYDTASGRRFDNASLLPVEWSVQNVLYGKNADGGGGVNSPLAVLRKPTTDGASVDGAASPMHVATVRDLVASGVEGVVKVSVRATANSHLHAHLTVAIVKPLQTSVDRLVLINRPNIVGHIALLHGSGLVSIVSSPHRDVTVDGGGDGGEGGGDVGLVHWRHHAVNNSVTVAPITAGALVLRVYDTCVPHAPPASVHVQVCDVTALELRVLPRVAVGGSTVARIWLLGCEDRRRLPTENFGRQLDLNLSSQSHDVTISRLKSDDLTATEATGSADNTDATPPMSFLLRGLAAAADVTITARTAVLSSHVQALAHVEVFQPLRLVPARLTLPVGAQLQLTYVDGPRRTSGDVRLVFSAAESTRDAAQPAASVTSAGLVTGLRPGVLSVDVRATDGETDSGVVFSQAEATVHVVCVCGVSLRASLTHMQRGMRQPLYVDGLDHMRRPVVFDAPPPLSVQPASEADRARVSVTWSTGEEDTLILESPLRQLGVGVGAGGWVMHVVASQAGRGRVSVTMSPPPPSSSSSSSYLSGNIGLSNHHCPAGIATNASLDITVYDNFAVVAPAGVFAGDSVVMAPLSSVPLATLPGWNDVRLLPSSVLSSTANTIENDRKSDNASLVRLVVTSSHADSAGYRLVAGKRRGVQTLLLSASVAGAGLGGAVTQWLSLLVEVTDVHYLMSTAEGPALGGRLQRPEFTSHLPTGMQLRVHVTAHDIRGRPMHGWPTSSSSEAGQRVSYASSRSDLVLVGAADGGATTGGVLVAVVSPASAAATVSVTVQARHFAASSDRLAAMMVVSYASLLPVEQTELIVGDVLCLHSHLLATGGGVWWRGGSGAAADDSDAVTVSTDGLAVARRSGITPVSLLLRHNADQRSGGPAVLARAQLHVRDIQQIHIERAANANMLVLCDPTAHNISLPVQLTSTNSRTAVTSRGRRAWRGVDECGGGGGGDTAVVVSSPFECRADVMITPPAEGASVAGLFSVQPAFNWQTGFHECILTATTCDRSQHNLISSHLQSATITITASAIISSSSSSPAAAAAASVQLAVLPAVRVEPSQLQLSAAAAAAGQAELLLLGAPHVLRDLHAEVNDRRVLKVSIGAVIDGIPARRVLSVSWLSSSVGAGSAALPSSAGAFSVLITAPRTNQLITVPVSVPSVLVSREATLSTAAIDSRLMLCPATAASSEAGWWRVVAPPLAAYWWWLMLSGVTSLAVAAAGARWLWSRAAVTAPFQPRLIGPPPPPPPYSGLSPDRSKIGSPASSWSPGRTHLWTDSVGPSAATAAVYGSPLLRRTSPYAADINTSGGFQHDRSSLGSFS